MPVEKACITCTPQSNLQKIIITNNLQYIYIEKLKALLLNINIFTLKPKPGQETLAKVLLLLFNQYPEKILQQVCCK